MCKCGYLSLYDARHEHDHEDGLAATGTITVAAFAVVDVKFPWSPAVELRVVGIAHVFDATRWSAWFRLRSEIRQGFGRGKYGRLAILESGEE